MKTARQVALSVDLILEGVAIVFLLFRPNVPLLLLVLIGMVLNTIGALLLAKVEEEL